MRYGLLFDIKQFRTARVEVEAANEIEAEELARAAIADNDVSVVWGEEANDGHHDLVEIEEVEP